MTTTSPTSPTAGSDSDEYEYEEIEIEEEIEVEEEVSDEEEEPFEEDEEDIEKPDAEISNDNKNNNHSKNHHHQQNRMQETVAAPAEGKGYAGNQPLCNQCKLHHTGPCEGRSCAGNQLPCNQCKLHHTGLCTVRCRSCQKVGHLSTDCRSKDRTTTRSTRMRAGTCFGCGEMGHHRSKCPKNSKKKEQQVEGVHGRAYVTRNGEPQQDPNVVTGKETIISDEEKAPQCDGGMISAEVTNLKNESSKEVTGEDAVSSLNVMDKVPHLKDQNKDAVNNAIKTITAPLPEDQTTLMITDDVNDAQHKEPRLDASVTRPRSSSPAVGVNEGNKRPVYICDSPATEVNEESKRQAIICDFFTKGWCIKGNSCRFRHIKDHTSVSDQQSEPQNGEGLTTSAAAPSITHSSEVKPELQKENIATMPSVKDADSSLHEASSNLINGSDTLKNTLVSSYATTEKPGGTGNQFGFHNNKMPTTSYSINHNSSSFQSTTIMPPSNHTSVWPMTSSFLSSSTLKHLGSQSEHLYSTSEVLLNPVTKLSTYEWAPSRPFRSSFLISQGIYTPDIQYDPIRDSIESPKIEDKLSKFPSSRLPSISGTHSPKNVNPLLIETIGMTNASDRGSLASHVNDNEIDMDITSEKGNTKSEGKGKLHLTSGHVGNVKHASEHDSHYSQHKNEGSTKQVKVRDESSRYHKIELDPEGDMRREPKAFRVFRAALIEFIKELVKPTWREGKLSKDAHNLIVKRAVDKVVSSLTAEQIPSMQIDMYLSASKSKLEKLVEGYIEKYGKL